MAFLDDKDVETIEPEDVQNEQDTDHEEIVVEEESAEKEQEKVATSKNEKSKRSTKIGRAFSELKKVSWPGFGRVVKETLVVLSVTAIFLVVVIGIDQLLYLLYNLLTKNMGA